MKFRINDIIKLKDENYDFKLKIIEINNDKPRLYKLQVLECRYKYNEENINSSIYKIGSSSWKLAKNVDNNYEIEDSYKLLRLVNDL
jgi:uncharacterized membrane protein